MTIHLRCQRWPLGMVGLGLALLVFGVASVCQLPAVNPPAVGQVPAQDTPKDTGAEKPPAALFEAAVVPLTPLAADSPNGPSPIDLDRIAERIGTESVLPLAVSDVPTGQLPNSESKIQNAESSAETLREPPIQVGNDAGGPAAMPKPAACGGDFGTALTFARNPAEAAKLAKRDKKLAFFLHVSGNFEDSGFT